MRKILDVTLEKGGSAQPKSTIYQFVAVPEQLRVWIKAYGYQDWVLVDIGGLFNWGDAYSRAVSVNSGDAPGHGGFALDVRQPFDHDPLSLRRSGTVNALGDVGRGSAAERHVLYELQDPNPVQR